MQETTIGIMFGLAAMLGFGLGNGFSRPLARSMGNKQIIFFRTVATSLILLPVLLFSLPSVRFSALYIIIGFVIAVISYFPLMTFYMALKKSDLGVVCPIANSSVIFTVLLSVIFFSERPSIFQYLSIGLIVAGIILISVNFRDIKRSEILSLRSGVPFAVITCILWGIVFFLFKIPVSVIGPILTSFIIEFGIMISSSAHIVMARERFLFPSKKNMFYIVIVALFSSAGTLFFNMGIDFADVSVVSAVTMSNPLVAVIFGRLAYKEKLTRIQWTAVLLVVFGIVLVSLF
ncbi:DMT family transporter [Candidatus Woesearchaeota archaeon]|nr:DMT family transporter [Candidatus Woesearchaeota archaeon]